MSTTVFDNHHHHHHGKQSPSPGRLAIASKTEQNSTDDLTDEPAGRPEDHLKAIQCDGYLKCTGYIDVEQEVLSVKYNETGSLIASGLSNGLIKISRPDNHKNVYVLQDADLTAVQYPCTSVKFLSDYSAQREYSSYLLSTHTSGFVKLWLYSSCTAFKTVREPRQVFAVTLNSDETEFLTSGANEAINIYDMETFQIRQTCRPSNVHDEMDGHRMRVFALKYHPSYPHVFLSGGWDGTIQVWDDRKQHSVSHLFGPHICGDALDIDPVHDHVLTGSWRREDPLQIWDFKTLSPIKNVPLSSIYGSLLYSAAWCGEEDICCGGGNQNLALLIQRSSLSVLGAIVNLPKASYAIDHHVTEERRGHNGLVQHNASMAVASSDKIFICEKILPNIS